MPLRDRSPLRDRVPLGGLALWAGFLLVHAWLTFLGVVVLRGAAFYDVDLYRWWVGLALDTGQWPVLDTPWVYPVGALAPMLVPAAVSTVSTPGYALGWCAMVTVLDAVALAVLTSARTGGRPVAGWWWLGFLVLLGPVAVGRLDAVVVPTMIIALALAVRSARGSRVAAVLLTVGAWIKVAPGALLIPIAAAARRPVRTVVLPAAAVCGLVLLTVAAGGGLGRVLGFLTEQQGRGLQVESVAATGWVLAALVRDDIAIELNQTLITYEVNGPGTTAVAPALDVVLVLGVAAVGLAVLIARRRGTAGAVVLPASLVLMTVLIVANKVGSPQLMSWVAAPLAVLFSTGAGAPPTGCLPDDDPAAVRKVGGRGGEGWVRVAGVLGLVVAGLTQIVFPWGYDGLLQGHAAVTVVLAVRNLLLLALLACAAVGLRAAVIGRSGTAVGPAASPGRAGQRG